MVKWTSVWAWEAEKTSKTKWKLTYGTPCMFCNIYLFELIVCKFNYSSFLFIILFPKCQVIVQCQTLYFSAKNCYLFYIFMAVYIASDKFPCWGQSKANTNVFFWVSTFRCFALTRFYPAQVSSSAAQLQPETCEHFPDPSSSHGHTFWPELSLICLLPSLGSKCSPMQCFTFHHRHSAEMSRQTLCSSAELCCDHAQIWWWI